MRKFIKINEDRVFFLDNIRLINTGVVNMVFDYGGGDEYVTPALELCDQRSLLVRIEMFLFDDNEVGLRVIIKDKSWSNKLDTMTKHGDVIDAEKRGYDNAVAELREAARHVGDPKGREAGVKRVRAERLEAHNDLINDIARGLTTPQEAASNSLGLNSLDPVGAAMKREASKPPEGVSQGGPGELMPNETIAENNRNIADNVISGTLGLNSIDPPVTIAEQMAYNTPEAKAERGEIETPDEKKAREDRRNKARENRNKPPVFKRGGPNRC